MEKVSIAEDIPVLGFKVATFPEGIGDAFGSLFQTLPQGDKRNYYGISYCDNGGGIVYKVAATMLNDNEAEKYKYESYTISNGDYLSVPVLDWRAKTHQIKDVFHETMQQDNADKSSQCIEWYKDDNEMLCLIKSK